MDQTDAQLISRSLEQPADFGAIFDRHASVLLRFLVRRAGRDLGATLLGELFRVAFERRASFDLERTSARPWLFGIATNLLMHRSRSDARQARATRVIEADPLVERASSIQREIVEEVDARLLLPTVVAALRLIPEGEREALLLFAWEELTYPEIAEALDVPVGTVRSRIHRARKRLRELLALTGKQRLDPESPAPREGR